jgi:hypothetical protein
LTTKTFVLWSKNGFVEHYNKGLSNGTPQFKKCKQWKGINRKQSTRWQHLSQLKASAFFSLQKNFSCFETQQLILGTGTAIWWVTEPHCLNANIY